jgi:D-amino-acid dehydrogenase
VRPAKGYSVEFDIRNDPRPLRIPVVDDDLHAAIVPLGDVLRIAGTAEFAGYDHTPNPARIRNLTDLLRAVLPQTPLDPRTGKPWSGLRALSADGVPLIGATALPNLWANTGHGHLGWTMAAGSGHLLAALIGHEPPAIDPSPYDPRRFAT